MSPEKSSSRLLIIDEDSALAEALAQQFEAAGYRAFSAASGEKGLDLATTARPDLILLALRLPDQPGIDVFRALRDRPRTGHIPVMILARRDETLLQNKVLEEGAYDFIEKPVDMDILALRVRNALRRAEREGLSEPRTGLPTGRLIEERVRTLEHEAGWTMIDLKIDGFNVFRDLYGFVTANEALRFAGNLILQIVNEAGSQFDFVGHPTGSEQFIVITSLAHGPHLAEILIQRLGQELQSFYNFMERDQGYVLVEDGTGGMVEKPLMSVQVEISQGAPGDYTPSDESGAADAWGGPGDDTPTGQPGSSSLDW